LIAQAVKAFGFNTTLAPVLDLALPESAKVMGTRSAGETAGSGRVCARLSRWPGGA
jgi:beta-N-acetylhexosaminidase